MPLARNVNRTIMAVVGLAGVSASVGLFAMRLNRDGALSGSRPPSLASSVIICGNGRCEQGESLCIRRGAEMPPCPTSGQPYHGACLSPEQALEDAAWAAACRSENPNPCGVDCPPPPSSFSPPTPRCGDGRCEPRMESPDTCPLDCSSACSIELGKCGGSPALRMSEIQCPDGTTGGNTGRCMRNADGRCGWEIRECPQHAICGNGACDAGESQRSCPDDCDKQQNPAACGNGRCEQGESLCIRRGAEMPPCPTSGQPYHGACLSPEQALEDAAWAAACRSKNPNPCGVDCPPPPSFSPPAPRCGDGKCEMREVPQTCPEDCGQPGFCYMGSDNDERPEGCFETVKTACASQNATGGFGIWFSDSKAECERFVHFENKARNACGNGVCDSGESPKTCVDDCPIPDKPNRSCGNGVCDSGESPKTCPNDCSKKQNPDESAVERLKRTIADLKEQLRALTEKLNKLTGRDGGQTSDLREGLRVNVTDASSNDPVPDAEVSLVTRQSGQLPGFVLLRVQTDGSGSASFHADELNSVLARLKPPKCPLGAPCAMPPQVFYFIRAEKEGYVAQESSYWHDEGRTQTVILRLQRPDSGQISSPIRDLIPYQP